MRTYIINTKEFDVAQSWKVTTYLALQAIEDLEKEYGAQHMHVSTTIQDLQRGAAHYNAYFEVEEIPFTEKCDYTCISAVKN
ncbi:MAG: hypothetical protein PQJ49_01075 [Sphaerochaetaceae bacterium]|nr:hypothetical protein [Sphaerochaetaceae bacterium]